MNNPNVSKKVGEWISEEEILNKEHNNVAVLWPKAGSIAHSMSNNEEISEIIATSDAPVSPVINNLEGVRQLEMLSHELAHRIPNQVNLEYGWALAHDTIESLNDGLNLENAMRKIADTSETYLEPGGTAIYNLESVGSRYEMPKDENLSGHENQIEYARKFEDILKDEYTDSTRIIEEPEFNSKEVHLIWEKPEYNS